MDAKVILGVASGPCCYRCKRTQWSYERGAHTVAVCLCGYSEGPLEYRGGGVWLAPPSTAKDASRLHAEFLKPNKVIPGATGAREE